LIDLLRTAGSQGAVVLNYVPVVSITKNREGIVDGVEFEDVETGRRYCVNAKAVVNAAGIFSSAVGSMSDTGSAPQISYSQGVHLVFDRKFLSGDAAVLIPRTSDGRLLFCIPWKAHVLVGTTDTPVDSPTLEPLALESEIDFILETAANYLALKPSRDDIKSVFAGIRPLIKKGMAKTSSLSRGHALFVDRLGLVTITGGKWTTYRKMAEDAIERAADVGGLKRAACVTASLPIEPPADSEDDTLLSSNVALTRGEVLRGVRDEMARSVEDVLARRTRSLFLDANSAIDVAQPVAKVIAAELGQDDDRMEKQLADFCKLAKGYMPRLRSQTED
jgi:glycerol-3-phosphate dehydrogenase